MKILIKTFVRRSRDGRTFWVVDTSKPIEQHLQEKFKEMVRQRGQIKRNVIKLWRVIKSNAVSQPGWHLKKMQAYEKITTPKPNTRLTGQPTKREGIHMILYATRKTFEQFHLKMPDEMISKPMALLSQAIIDRECDDAFMHWGCKLFFFDRRKCMQVVHFQSKLTIFLIDISLDMLEGIGQMVAFYLFEQYKGNAPMTRLLKQLFEDSPGLVFDHLRDRSAAATLNQTQRSFLRDGERLYEYINDGILNTRKLNISVNRKWLFTRMVDGVSEYFVSEVLFEELLRERYRGKKVKQSGRVDPASFAGIEVKQRH